MSEALQQALQAVADARRELAGAKSGALMQEDALKESEEWQLYQIALYALTMAEQGVAETEAAAREAILAQYETTGNKAPLAGASIKVYKRLRYDGEQAAVWCKDHAPDLLVTSLDKKRFEKVAVDLGAPVEVLEEPRAQLASDLSVYEGKE